jgi:hypothetical protein
VKATTRGLFLQQLKKRQEAWSQAKLSARITVPPELDWWYWNEFGTATKADPGRGSGHTYSIEPKDAKALAFPGANGTVITARVDAHPGIKPSRSVAESRAQIDELLKSIVGQAVAQYADNPQEIQRVLHTVAEQAVDIISDALSQNLNGVRNADPLFPNQMGKLHGQRPGDVFKQNASVVDGD